MILKLIAMAALVLVWGGVAWLVMTPTRRIR
jgi:hypothetical protein